MRDGRMGTGEVIWVLPITVNNVQREISDAGKRRHSVYTRLCSVCGDSAAPWAESCGVAGLYLNLVLSPGIQALYCGLTGLPSSLYIYIPVLPLAIRHPHTQPVSHSLWAAVILRHYKRLEGKTKCERRNKIVRGRYFAIYSCSTYIMCS